MAYTTAAAVIAGHPLLDTSHVEDDWLTAADLEIDNRTGRSWELREDETIDVPGTGERWIDLNVDTIVSLTAVTMGDTNNGNIETVDSGDYVIKDGFVWLNTSWLTSTFRGFGLDDPVWIASGIDNCHFTGTFEEATPAIIKQIANLIVLRYVQGVHPHRFNWDAFKVETANAGYIQRGKFSIDELITHLIEIATPAHIKNTMVFV
tara:strand:- start:7225 stop:7842 length:618 start_codon:yes stop_codon:yes gene_type:complete